MIFVNSMSDLFHKEIPEAYINSVFDTMEKAVEGKVGPAHTTDTAYYFFAPQVGVVAMISQEDVEAFWIIHIDTASGKVLASAG